MYDGYFLSTGIDIHKLIKKLPAARLYNFFEYVLFDDAIKNLSLPEDSREKLRGRIISIRKYGKIQEEGWTNDNPYRQPTGYIEPTENGYPGLEAPVG